MEPGELGSEAIFGLLSHGDHNIVGGHTVGTAVIQLWGVLITSKAFAAL